MATITFIVITYILSVFIFIKHNEAEIDKRKEKIFLKTDERFKDVQKIIDNLNNSSDYETTFLNEVVKFRTQSQKYKKENKYKDSLINELKIGKILNNLSLLIEDFNEFKNISKEKMKIMNENFIKLDLEIKHSISFYNIYVSKYNKRKTNIMFFPYMLLFRFSVKKIDLFIEKI